MDGRKEENLERSSLSSRPFSFFIHTERNIWKIAADELSHPVAYTPGGGGGGRVGGRGGGGVVGRGGRGGGGKKPFGSFPKIDPFL